MARITPSAGRNIDFTELEDHEPYQAVLQAIAWSTGDVQYGAEQRLQLDWQLGEDPEDTLRDWLGLRLGKQKAGGVSKLRQLLNALSAKPADAEVAWFDTETLEWGYDDRAYNKLVEGMPVIIRGVHGSRADGQPKFTIQTYQAVKKAAETKKKLQPAAALDVSPDQVPF